MSSFKFGRSMACLLAIVSVAAQTQPAGKGHSLRGQIVDSLTRRPITDVELALSTVNWESAAEPVIPDSRGQFIFHGLAAGEYLLSAARPDFGTIFFGESPDQANIQTIQVTQEDEEKVVVFRLLPRGDVTGVVRDELGDPVLWANVTLSRRTWNDGRIALEQFNQATTDDRGQYRINNVRQGSYVLCAVVNFPGSGMAPSSTHVDFSSHGEARYYARSCYAGSGGPARSAVRIAPGQHATADLTIASSSAVWVRGRIVNRGPNPLGNAGIGIRLVPNDPLDTGGQFWPGGVDAAKGTFAFRGIPPGNYRVEANVNGQTGGQNGSGEKVSLTGRLTIQVGAADVDDLELDLQPTAEIEVVLHGPEGEMLKQGASVGLRSSTLALSGTRWAEAQKDSLRFTSLAPGAYWFLTRSVSSPSKDLMCVESARLGDEEILHGQMIVTSAMTARLNVTVSKHCGVIKGRVVSNEKPVPNAKLLLLLSGSASNPGDLITDFADDEGEFSFQGMPFGRYRLWAWTVDEFGSFVGPPSLADEEKNATTVDIRSDEPVRAEISLLKPEGKSK